MINRIADRLPQGNVSCIIRMDENNVVSVRIAATVTAARQEFERALSERVLVARFHNVPALVAGRMYEEHNDEHLANCSTHKEALTWVRKQARALILEDRSGL